MSKQSLKDIHDILLAIDDAELSAVDFEGLVVFMPDKKWDLGVLREKLKRIRKSMECLQFRIAKESDIGCQQ